ncbi:pleckstrin homology domain-containing family A member 8 [Galendromus occidentalis]|uniref:Pleckstrin homology domain-containing family A member 8 n=1 Tax=Galendromus occidentalis TaxID=34638 RepID=A0AAJ6VYJ1_9ACAR|nr:pleckstrin homology domain-containing family A member 8 [Galendromus occidentalis]
MSVSRSTDVVEGTLCKWTNLWNGWQPRWFVLEKGVLTYYKSREEVCQGCKGSVKVSACEIVPHHVNSKRLDIIIPSEQHYYLMAQSETERQIWLVALGSVKQAAFSAETATAVSTNTVPELVHSIKKKKTKLRWYCDQLMQQVHTIKNSEDADERVEAAGRLNATCDMFIRCLEDCVDYTESTAADDGEAKEIRSTIPAFNGAQSAITGMVGALEKQKKSQRPSSTSSQHSGRDRSTRTDSLNIKDNDESESRGDEVFLDLNGNNDDSDSRRISTESLIQRESSGAVALVGGSSAEDQVPTFFTLMEHSFTKLKLESNDIPLGEFLLCCEGIVPVFDVLGSTAFAPVKMDIQGNISKLQKHGTETGCTFLLALIQRELDMKTTTQAGSATDALLWLKRALAFIRIFLHEACQSADVDLALCATKAYGETLRKHHNFVVRGVFSVAIRALPYYSTFVKSLAPSPAVANNPAYETTLKSDGIEYTKHLQIVVTTIDTFYVRNDIVSPQNL